MSAGLSIAPLIRRLNVVSKMHVPKFQLEKKHAAQINLFSA
jgi:hypothetical protein